MRKLITIILLSTSIFGFSQNEITLENKSKNQYPTNFNESDFDKMDAFNGKVVAFDAVIEQIENTRNNTPYYKLKIGSKYIWTALMFKNDESKIGFKIRVVGFLSEVPNEEEKSKEYKYHVLVFGLIDFQNSNFLFLSGAKIQKQEWIDGKIPSQ